jgi:redox-sensitive bicupin YhaK (pirin superfamily)
LYIGALTKGQTAEKDIAKGRNAYVHVARGKLNLNGLALGEGDGAKIADESQLKFAAPEDAEVLLFDLP